METVVVVILRVIAVGILIGGLSVLGQGVIDIGDVLDYEHYSVAEKIAKSMVVVGGMLVVGGATLAVSYAVWNIKNILEWL